jgi:hypothetical protein
MTSDPPNEIPPKDKTPEHEKVGYKTPPKHHQWVKGQSGNKKGRPKGSTNFLTSLVRQFRAPVTMREGNKTRTVSKFEFATASHLAHASNGKAASVGALKILRDLAYSLDEKTSAKNTATLDPFPRVEVSFVSAKPAFAGQIIQNDAEGNVYTNEAGSFKATKLLYKRT